MAATTSLLSLLFSTTTSVESVATMTPSVRVIPQSKLHVSEPNPQWFGNGPNPTTDPSWTHSNWLQSRFHFSFAEYHNPANTNFGVLRVMNDDLVQPHRGFGTHPHANMEILTYVVQGQLTHADSMGTRESLGRGSMQFMTAGSGIRHSEANEGDVPLRFIQTWIVPSEQNLEPKYGSFRGDPTVCTTNQWHHLVSNAADSSVTTTPVQVNQDVDVFAAELDSLGTTLVHNLPAHRQAYLLCIEGSVTVNGHALTRHDACEITGAEEGGRLEIQATATEPTEHGEVAHVLLFTMKSVPGAGRTDLLPSNE